MSDFWGSVCAPLRRAFAVPVVALLLIGCAHPGDDGRVDLERDVRGFLRGDGDHLEAEIVEAVFEEYLQRNTLFLPCLSTLRRDMDALHRALSKTGRRAVLVPPEDLVLINGIQFADVRSGERCHVPIVSGITAHESGYTVHLRDMIGLHRSPEAEEYVVRQERGTGTWQAQRTQEYHFHPAGF